MKKIFFLIYEVFIFLPILIIASILTAIIVMVGISIGNKNFWSYYPPKYWSKLICRIALCRVNVVKKVKLDPKQSYIFVPNHQGAFDIFLIYGYLGVNIKWVQKQELRKIPFVGKASEMAGHVFVDQTSLKSMKETIHKAEEQITDGVSMTIFPEGARTRDGKMLEFKKTFAILSKELNVEVIPFGIKGAYEAFPTGKNFPRPSKVEINFFEGIDPQGKTYDEIVNEARNTIKKWVE